MIGSIDCSRKQTSCWDVERDGFPMVNEDDEHARPQRTHAIENILMLSFNTFFPLYFVTFGLTYIPHNKDIGWEPNPNQAAVRNRRNGMCKSEREKRSRRSPRQTSIPPKPHPTCKSKNTHLLVSLIPYQPRFTKSTRRFDVGDGYTVTSLITTVPS